MVMLETYFRNLYDRTMKKTYQCGYDLVTEALKEGGKCLDCGAGEGQHFAYLRKAMGLEKERYAGIEWNSECVETARTKGIPVIHGDLNRALPFADGEFRCVFGFSVLEHLLNGCRWMREAQRVLQPEGSLVVITPNIATWFTALLIVLGRMPSIGPHPDSLLLKTAEAPLPLGIDFPADIESDAPLHRHLVVFSYRALKRYLDICGFADVKGQAFGVYPFPAFLQPLMERIDPWHCHQMVFIAKKSASLTPP
jgi:SAM-dependent methyltransferase